MGMFDQGGRLSGMDHSDRQKEMRAEALYHAVQLIDADGMDCKMAARTAMDLADMFLKYIETGSSR